MHEVYEQPAAPWPDDASDQNSLDLLPCPAPDEQPDATFPDDASYENTDIGDALLQPAPLYKVKRADLLLKEIDEINNWARLGCLLCFGFCTLFLTVNGVAIAWFATSNRAFVFFLLILLNLVGALATVLVGKYLLECDQRIRDVIWILTKDQGTDDPWSWPQSGIPRKAIKILFGFTASALIVLVMFWTVLFVTAN
jgi:hypothetical protein